MKGDLAPFDFWTATLEFRCGTYVAGSCSSSIVPCPVSRTLHCFLTRSVGREVLVVAILLVNGVLALGLDVPDLDLVVATSGKDLSVISGQGDGEDVLGVSNELVDGLAGGDVPEADGAVPRGREAEATISSEADLVNEVRVSGEHLLGSSPLNIILISVSFVKLPLDKGLVARAGEEEFNFLSINLLLTNSEGGNPATVA